MIGLIIILLMFSLVMFVAVYPSNLPSQDLTAYRLQLTLTELIMLILLSVLTGFFQFFGSVLLLLLLSMAVYILKLRNVAGITILGIFIGFCCMIFAITMVIHIEHLEHEYFAGAAYLYALIPSVLTGGALGLYLAAQVKEINSDTEKRRILWFIYRPIKKEKLWSSKD